MCARRFLVAVMVLTLLVVAAAFAFYQWGGSVLLREATPKGHFVAAAAGGGPDYSPESSWVARPGPADDPSHPLPDRPVRGPAGGAASFFSHTSPLVEAQRSKAPP